MKNIVKSALVAVAISTLVGALGYLIFLNNDRVAELQESARAQEIRLAQLEQQVPNIAKFVQIVKELQEAAGDRLSTDETVEVARVIFVQCSAYRDIGLEPSIVFAVIERESAFDPRAISSAKAYGLTQCIRDVFELHLPALGYDRFTVDLALHPVVNVQVGTAELVRLRKYWLEEGVDSWRVVLTSYFWGTKNTWQLLLSKKRTLLPSLEYGQDIMNRAQQWKERGL